MSESSTSSAVQNVEIATLLGQRVAWQLHPESPDETDPRLADGIDHALSRPIDFPAIDQAIVPDDRVALAVDATLPDLVSVVGQTVRWLSRLRLQSIDVVLTAEADDERMMDLAAALGSRVRVTRHDAAHRESLMYLMADPAGDPIYLNRRIADADFVLPIRTCRRWRGEAHAAGEDFQSLAIWSDPSGTFPRFADSATRVRYAKAAAGQDAEVRSLEQSLTMTLGIQAVLEIRPGPRGGFAAATCGTPAGVAESASPATPGDVDESPCMPYVIACVDGGAGQQSWSNIARAALAAVSRVQPSGTLVLWSHLGHDPPSSLQRHLLRQDVDDSGDEDPSDDDPSDGGASAAEVNEDGFPPWSDGRNDAQALASVMDECRLFLCSGLSNEDVEELGMGVVTTAQQLDRLIPRDSQCGIIRAAQFFGPDLTGR